MNTGPHRSLYGIAGYKPRPANHTTPTPGSAFVPKRRQRDPRQTAPDPSDTWWKREQKPHAEELARLQELRAQDARRVPRRAKRT